MTMTNLKLVRPLDQHYHNLFITACEGGVNYWAQVNEYHWGYDGVDDLDGFSAYLVDHEDDEQVWELDRSVVARGWSLATGEWRNKISWSTGKPPVVWTAGSDWDYDASDADSIVQLGLFGEVVYG